jgi:hypothetical protein
VGLKIAFGGILVIRTEGGLAMVMKSGERWHCMNPACLCAVLVETSGALEGSNPRCSCGSIMKKDYSPPVFRYLEFLREPELAVTPRLTRQD